MTEMTTKSLEATTVRLLASKARNAVDLVEVGLGNPSEAALLVRDLDRYMDEVTSRVYPDAQRTCDELAARLEEQE